MFDAIFINPVLNALVAFYKIYTHYHIPGAFGWAIISLTLIVRVVLHPLYQQQTQASKKMAEMKPKLDELSKKHKDDKQKMQQAQMDLYKEHGVNPIAGVLFLIIQFPIIIGLYQTLNRFVEAVGNPLKIIQLNKALYSPALYLVKLDPYFFGYNLAISPKSVLPFGADFFAALPMYWPYLLVPIVTGLLQYFQAKTMMPSSAKSEARNPKSETTTDSKSQLAAQNTKPETKSSADSFQSAMNTQMKYFLPVMIAYFSYTLPVGLSLYWNIFSLFSIIAAWKLSPQSKPLPKIS